MHITKSMKNILRVLLGCCILSGVTGKYKVDEGRKFSEVESSISSPAVDQMIPPGAPANLELDQRRMYEQVGAQDALLYAQRPWVADRFGDPALPENFRFSQDPSKDNGKNKKEKHHGKGEEEIKNEAPEQNEEEYELPLYGHAPNPALYRGFDPLYSPVPPPPSYPYGGYLNGGSYLPPFFAGGPPPSLYGNGYYGGVPPAGFPYTGGVYPGNSGPFIPPYPFPNNNDPRQWASGGRLINPALLALNRPDLLYNPYTQGVGFQNGVPAPGAQNIPGVNSRLFNYPSGYYSPWGVPAPVEPTVAPGAPAAAAPPPAFKEKETTIVKDGKESFVETSEKSKKDVDSPLLESVPLPNGGTMNVPHDQVNTLNGDISMFIPEANANGDVFNPLLKNAMNDAAIQTAKSLSTAESYYEAHRRIADKQAAAASQLQQYQMLGLHHEAIIDDLTASIEHLNSELKKTNEQKKFNDSRMDKLARQIKALELDKKRVDKEYELKRFTEKYGDISSKEDIEATLKSLKDSIDATNQDMVNVLEGNDISTSGEPTVPPSTTTS